MGAAETLERLATVREKGVITQAEFEIEKSKVLRHPMPVRQAAATPPPVPAALTQPPSPGPIRRFLSSSVLWVGGGAAMIIFAVVSTLSGGGHSKAPEPDTQSDYTTRAVTACKTSVKSNLKAPSTAEFPSAGVRMSGSGPTGTYTVTGPVDSENSFGGQIRASFACSMTFASGHPTAVSSTVLG